MSGADAIRGITFQHACAIRAALDVVSDVHAGALRLEASADVVDFDTLDAAGRVVRASQAKTRQEPYVIAPADIIHVISRWAAMDVTDVEFEFLTDGHLNRAADELRRGLRALQLSASDAEATDIMPRPLATYPVALLRRVRIHSRYGEAVTLLTLAESQLCSLANTLPAWANAEARINKLFRELSIRAGSRDITERTFSRAELAAILELDLADLGVRQHWTPALAELYRSRVASEAPTSIVLRAASAREGAVAQALVARKPNGQSAAAVDQLIPTYRRCVVDGPSGAGKSTALELLAHRLAAEGRLPVLVAPQRYVSGTLRQLVHTVVERVVGQRLSSGLVDAVLRDPYAALLIDGLTERPIDERNELRGDLVALTSAYPALAVAVTGRSADGFRLPDYEPLRLDGLDYAARVSIAAIHSRTHSEAAQRVDRLDRSLGSLVQNPLLLTMAVALDADGVEASSRPSLYRGIINGLWGRHSRDEPLELTEALLSRNARALVEDGVFAATRQRWLVLTAQALGHAHPGGDALKEAETFMSAMDRVGLIRSHGFERQVVFLHDSFRDYFAAQSYATAALGPPPVVTAAHEDSLTLFCEGEGLSSELALQLAAQHPLLLCRLIHLARRDDYALALELLRRMFSHIALVASFGPVSQLGFQVWSSHGMSWIALTTSGRAEHVSQIALPRTGGGASLQVLGLQGPQTPMALVTAMWQKLAKAAIRRGERRGGYWYADRARAASDVASALTSHAQQTEEEIAVLIQNAVPGVADFIRTAIGPTGLQARVLATAESDDDHDVWYRYVDAPHRVDVVDRFADDAERWGNTGAKYILEKSPSTTAVKRVVRALEQALERGE